MKLKNNQSDLENFESQLSEVFEHLGHCVDAAFEKQKTTHDVMNSATLARESMTKATLSLGKLAVKYIPKVVVAVADVRREIVKGIVDAYNETQKQSLDKEFEQKLQEIKQKQRNKNELFE